MAKKREFPEFRIRGVAGSMKEMLEVIASNKGITTATMIRLMLREFIENTPEKFKKKPVKD